MTYKQTWKRKKVWSLNANTAKERERLTSQARDFRPDLDPHIKIEITRQATGEHVIIELHNGDKINNYSVYCNDKYQGMQSITTVTAGIRKALPAFRRME